MKIIFMKDAWDDYLFWQQTDRNILLNINGLIKEITRTPFQGTGKPEALRANLAGFWSRRINQEHRLVYRVEFESVFIIQCRYHY
jgi:toxin YoeB